MTRILERSENGDPLSCPLSWMSSLPYRLRRENGDAEDAVHGRDRAKVRTLADDEIRLGIVEFTHRLGA
jgi:hypothetical protein